MELVVRILSLAVEVVVRVMDTFGPSLPLLGVVAADAVHLLFVGLVVDSRSLALVVVLPLVVGVLPFAVVLLSVEVPLSAEVLPLPVVLLLEKAVALVVGTVVAGTFVGTVVFDYTGLQLEVCTVELLEQ